MTAGELIDYLWTYPRDTEVCIETPERDLAIFDVYLDKLTKTILISGGYYDGQE